MAEGNGNGDPRAKPHGETYRVAMLHWNAVGMRAHGKVRAPNDVTVDRAEEFLQLVFDLGLFVGDIRNDVAEDVE